MPSSQQPSEVVAGRVPLLSGLAELSTDNAIAAARNYQRLGAQGLMTFPSLAYRTDRRETVAWYKSVAEASDLPVMIYNNPIAYKVDVDVETLKALFDVPGIVAIKEETGDIRRVTDLFNAFGDRFDIFCGVDDLILESLALGVVGWVSGMTNAWPAECVALFKAAMAGRLQSRSAAVQADDASLSPRHRRKACPVHQACGTFRLWRARIRTRAAIANRGQRATDRRSESSDRQLLI